MDWPIVQVSVNIGTSRPVTIQLVDVCISQMWHSVIISTVPHSLLLTTENQLSHFLVPIISQTCMYVVIQWTNQFNLKFVQQTHSLFFYFFFIFYQWVSYFLEAYELVAPANESTYLDCVDLPSVASRCSPSALVHGGFPFSVQLLTFKKKKKKSSRLLHVIRLGF